MPKVSHIPAAPRQALVALGKMLTIARKERGWRQQDLAERLGLTRQTVAQLEKGDAKAAIGHYFASAWLLDFPIFPGMEGKSSRGFVQFIELLKNKYPQRIAKSEKKIENDF